MKKTVFVLLIAALLCVLMSFTAFAAQLPRLVDDADLLTDEQEASLIAKLDEISKCLNFDLVVYTTNTLNGMTPEDAAIDFYDVNGYGFNDSRDGSVLLVSMEDRDWYLDVNGWGKEALNEDAREYISEEFLTDLSAGDYASAFSTYAELADEIVTKAENGEFYKTPFNFGLRGIISLVGSLIAGLVATSSMKGKLRSVHRQYAATNYVTENSLKVSEARENYLYRNVSSTVRATSSSSSRSGGSSHAGTGGKF